MKIKGLDGREYSWHPSNCQASCENRSSLHNKAKELLEQIFPYKNKMAFYKAKARDMEKREWCELNNMRLVELNYNEDIDEWRKKIE